MVLSATLILRLLLFVIEFLIQKYIDTQIDTSWLILLDLFCMIIPKKIHLKLNLELVL